MKKLLLILALLSLISPAYSQISAQNANKLADFIYLVEGGSKTKYPYGIKSIDTGGNIKFARQICLNSIKNNYIRWEKAGKPGDFIQFMGNRWCPVESDKIGNKNWIKNMNWYLKQNRIEIH